MEVSTFTCSICEESSSDICVYCTKDACANHLCERCRRCSDCCACGMPVFSSAPPENVDNHKAHGPTIAVQPELNGEAQVTEP